MSFVVRWTEVFFPLAPRGSFPASVVLSPRGGSGNATGTGRLDSGSGGGPQGMSALRGPAKRPEFARKKRVGST